MIQLVGQDARDLKDSVDFMIMEANRQGKPLGELIREKFKSWKTIHKPLILELFKSFVAVVQMGEDKTFGEGKWDQKSTFRDFLDECRQMASYRIDELRKLKREELRPEAFQKAAEVILTSGGKVQPGVGHKLSVEDLDFYEETTRKSYETIQLALSNDAVLTACLAEEPDNSADLALKEAFLSTVVAKPDDRALVEQAISEHSVEQKKEEKHE